MACGAAGVAWGRRLVNKAQSAASKKNSCSTGLLGAGAAVILKGQEAGSPVQVK